MEKSFKAILLPLFIVYTVAAEAQFNAGITVGPSQSAIIAPLEASNNAIKGNFYHTISFGYRFKRDIVSKRPWSPDKKIHWIRKNQEIRLFGTPLATMPFMTSGKITPGAYGIIGLSTNFDRYLNDIVFFRTEYGLYIRNYSKIEPNFQHGLRLGASFGAAIGFKLDAYSRLTIGLNGLFDGYNFNREQSNQFLISSGMIQFGFQTDVNRLKEHFKKR